MTLVVNHNMMATSTANILSSQYARLSKSTGRLSSGLRVNSSADDAAGLAIRELMRSDISSLHQGIRNANDAISLLQTADAALSIIDEKLIRMKELAEQAATGTYDSTQRLMIDSEFQQMASEIDRIANATDFNGIHLLNGSLSGVHNGKGLTSTGKAKIHFGSGNDSAEDYYYIEIGDATTRGLGLTEQVDSHSTLVNISGIPLNDADAHTATALSGSGLQNIKDVFTNSEWYTTPSSTAAYLIPKGTKNILINTNGHYTASRMSDTADTAAGDNDIELFTLSGVHLAGTRQSDTVFHQSGTSIDANKDTLGFTSSQLDETYLNEGVENFTGDYTLNITYYNGMKIGYNGDYEYRDSIPNNGVSNDYPDYEILTIDEATEDLILWYPGVAAGFMKVYQNASWTTTEIHNKVSKTIDIQTQDKAQKALIALDNAIVQKDNIRAHLGALQNRLENTITNISTQAENLMAAESRISDVDIATEMTNFVRNQILTQSAVAMLSQANSLPQMAMQIIGG